VQREGSKTRLNKDGKWNAALFFLNGNTVPAPSSVTNTHTDLRASALSTSSIKLRCIGTYPALMTASPAVPSHLDSSEEMTAKGSSSA